jgi:hypothetical protein
MKKLALLAVAAGAATLAPQAASAQVIINNGGGGFHHGGLGHGGFGGGNFFGGFAFGGFFHQPQFHVQNWQLYGFIAPRHDQRWVRYYDDAYLVDRRGYIHDRRQRVNWDRYGERWERDERGIPYYVGRGDYHPRGRDYQRAEHERRYSSGWDYSGYGSACGRAERCDDYRGAAMPKTIMTGTTRATVTIATTTTIMAMAAMPPIIGAVAAADIAPSSAMSLRLPLMAAVARPYAPAAPATVTAAIVPGTAPATAMAAARW